MATTRPSPEDAHARADAALLRASRSALAAEIQERRARDAPAWLREVHEGLVDFHRRAQQRHEASASLQLAHASRLKEWASLQPLDGALPSFFSGLGEVVGAESAVVLVGTDDTPALIATSGGLAQRAVQLEYVIDEGPMHDCNAHRRAVAAVHPLEIWPTYGRAALTLGVQRVAANPLVAAGRHLGVLTTFNQRDGGTDDQTSLSSVAEAVTDSILDLAQDSLPESPGWEVLETSGRDVAALVNCASGMVAASRGCPPEVARSLITSRAVAAGEEVEAVARRILDPERPDDL